MRVQSEQITLEMCIKDFIRTIWAVSGLVDKDRYRILSYDDYPRCTDTPVVMFRLDTCNPVAGLANVRFRDLTDKDNIQESIGTQYQCVLTLIAYQKSPMFFLETLRSTLQSTEFYNVLFDKPYLGITNCGGVRPIFEMSGDQEWGEQSEFKITFSAQTNVNSILKLYDLQKVLFEIDTREVFSA